MRIVYVLLSPTFGMHQYTADLANRMAGQGHDTVLVTATTFARDRYSPAVQVITPITTHNTGFSFEGLRGDRYRQVTKSIRSLDPDVVHITGVHAWNVPLVRWLRKQGIPVVHTLHDLDPHLGVGYSSLIKVWNRAIIRSVDHLLVHGQVYARRLIAGGCDAGRVSYLPLLHLFLSFEGFASLGIVEVDYGNWGLFFGRLERYKGVAQLIDAERMLPMREIGVNLIVAGSGGLDTEVPHTATVEIRNHRIDDAEAIDLFSRCGVVILPYLDASQSALIASAYYFGKPVIVTDVGALGEYVQHGVTGWVVPAGDARALADAWQAALSDGGRLQQMGEAGRGWYHEQRGLEQASLNAMYLGLGKAEGLL
ncbi:MAG TPA: glycosyltransferase family 4 protein [Anaerolineae bacterium]|nr:glycosyltransferase family 4 protein [Anaerolineae bacterium]